MIIYWPGVYTFNGYFSEEDLQMFWVYRYKGFSFTAARTVHTALVLAGQQGCSRGGYRPFAAGAGADTHGDSGGFPAPQAGDIHRPGRAYRRPRGGPSAPPAQPGPCPELSKAMEFAVLGAHAASAARAENDHLLLRHSRGFVLHGQSVAGGSGHRAAAGRAGMPPAFRSACAARPAADGCSDGPQR